MPADNIRRRQEMAYDMYGNWFPPGAPGYAQGPNYGYGPPMSYGYGPMYPPEPPIWTHHHMEDFWPDYSYHEWEPSDDDITDMVLDSITSDPFVLRSDWEDIEVETIDAIVRISGTVGSKEAKHAIHSDVFWTYGVVDVIDELTVVEKPRSQRRQPTRQMAGAPSQRTGASQRTVAEQRQGAGEKAGSKQGTTARQVRTSEGARQQAAIPSTARSHVAEESSRAAPTQPESGGRVAGPRRRPKTTAQ
jgi:hypothetical protein